MKIKTKRNFRRIQERNQKEVTKYLCLFIEDCKQYNKGRWKSLYEQYDKMWMDYAARINRVSKEITIYSDSFEDCILSGYDLLQDRSDKKAVEILYYFKKKTIFERIKNYLKDYYARALAK